MQKHRIYTNIGIDQKVTVELKQDYDLLEILSLKFSQQEAYSSFCGDYGVVCGRVTVNNGLGVPNAKVSIFVPITELDKDDPVISRLYPYSLPTDKDEDNRRYNLLPSRKQHGGHVPVGTFPDQSEILSREEILEVYDSYYKFTVKTNSAGDFMIWGVPLGEQTVHIDLDLSDMGCFSFRPYDFIRQGESPDIFDRYYNFRSDTDLDGLPQIVSFTKTIEVYPFWGNQDLCEIGITRVDYDLSSSGIKVEPISLVLISTVTDNNSRSVKRTGVIRPRSGYKCNLETKEGSIEGVRFTINKIKGSDGITEYPELEYFNPGAIDENGSSMAVIPMNMDYTFTNQFGEEEISNDPNKGVPTTTIVRFRIGLDDSGVGRKGTNTAYYLIPNIREFNPNTSGQDRGQNRLNEYHEALLSTYVFSDKFEDYINYPTLTPITRLTPEAKEYKKNLMLGAFNDGIPEDYFYKFTYGKVYTPSSFQGSHYEVSAIESFFGLTRRDAFLGLKEIRPNVEDDCSGVANYIPTNFGFRNRIKFGLLLSAVILFINFIITVIIIKLHEFVGRFLLEIGRTIARIGINIRILRWYPFERIGELFQNAAYTLQERGTKVLSLVTYPDCEDCTEDVENSSNDLSVESVFASIGEVKCKVFSIGSTTGQVLLIPIDINTSTASGSTFLRNTTFINDIGGAGTPAREFQTTGLTRFNTFDLNITTLQELQNYTIAPREDDPNRQRFIATVYPLIDDTVLPFDQGPHPNYNKVRSTPFTEFVSSFSPPNDDLPTTIFFSRRFYKHWHREDVPRRFFWRFDPRQLNWFNTQRNPAYYERSDGVNMLRQWININGWGNTNDGNGKRPIEMIVATLSHETWGNAAGVSYNDYGGERNGFGGIIDRGTYAILKIYDRNVFKVDPNTLRKEVEIETGCQKYDKLYNENIRLNSLWAPPGVKYGNPHGSYGSLVESNTNPNPSGGFTIISDISANSGSGRMPRIIAWRKIGTRYYDRRTKSGLSEVRDGVFTCIPVIQGPSNNIQFILEWYRRKRVGQFFCGGVLNYCNIENWLHGLLYMFKFDYRIRWDNEDNFDLNQRGSRFPRELIFFNVFEKKFYYRSTPFNYENFSFMGQKPNSFSPYVELLRPTTFYDVGVRDEFFYEICQDPRLDPNCSVIREINVTSYQDPANIVEHAINYKLDVTNARADVKDFFLGTGYEMGKILNGDITQLMSINCEVGVREFDLDSPQYFMFNGEFLDPEDPTYLTYFKNGGDWGPTPIDFKFDERGRFVRLCLNNRLGDFSQKVPFFLWDRRGPGFGGMGSSAVRQRFDRKGISVQKLQRIVSFESVNDTTTNYNMDDGEEEFLLRPMTITHGTFSWQGNFTDMVERFDEISLNPPSNPTRYVEGNLWLEVTAGGITNPTSGNIYVIVNETWVGPIAYLKDQNELFIFETATNYSGQKLVLSTPFHFYFGLIPGKTPYDTFIKYYGPKGAFPPAE